MIGLQHGRGISTSVPCPNISVQLTLVDLRQELLLDNIELLGNCRLPSPNVRQVNVIVLSQVDLWIKASFKELQCA